MSEAPDAAEAFDAEFDAAREAEREAPEAAEAASEQEEEQPAREVDWQKRAHDKEGLAAKERSKRRAIEQQFRDLQAEVERLKSQSSRSEPSEDDIAAIVNALRDDDDDPITDIGSIKRALKLFIKDQSQTQEAETRAAREQEGVRRLVATMNESEADFAEDHPDYQDAVKHFKEARRAEFEDMGYAGRELEQALAQDFLQLAQRSINGGRDPAEVVYNLAKKRGFQSGKAAADEKLKEIAAAATTRTPSGGSRGEARLTADSINKLRGAAYDAAWAKMREQERRAG